MRVFNRFDYKSLRQGADSYLETKLPSAWPLVCRHKTGIKYVFSGGMAAVVDLVVLYVLTDILGVWYLISAIVAFVFALATSFFLQKFWTFRDNSLRRIKKQLIIYFFLGLANFILNPVLLYVVVEKFHVWYLAAAVIVMGTLAICNYLINKFITFKKEDTHESVDV